MYRAEVARRALVRQADVGDLIGRNGRDIEVVYAGLRTGEKLHEELLGADEVDARPNHPLITQALVPPLNASFALRAEHGTELSSMWAAGDGPVPVPG